MDVLSDALAQVLTWEVLLVMLVSALYGLLVGAIPGLTATLAVALMVPITFFMDPVPAIAAIVTMAAMAIFAGDLPAVLLRMPGTPASAAYTDQAYQLTMRGQGEYILGVSAVTSAVGGSIGVLVLMFGAPYLAEFALEFSAFEYFWLACLGLTAAIMVGGTASISKSAISLVLGLLVACVGIDPVSGESRFTFGSQNLLGGFGFIPVIIGLFAVAEILRFCIRSAGDRQGLQVAQAPLFSKALRDAFRHKVGILRGSAIGTLTGALPGAGADIAAYISYAIARRRPGQDEDDTATAVRQIAPATAANNAAVGGSFIPATVFGIPGDSLTAIVIGVLLMKGLTPGPTIFSDNASMINAVFLAFLLANLLLIPFGFLAVRAFKQVLRIPQAILMPSILLFAMVGAYAIEHSLFAVVTILIFGVLGFLLEEHGFPLAPMILGLVLGPLLEETFVTSMMRSNGDLMAFFERPVSLVLAAVTLGVWLVPPLLRACRGRGAARAAHP
ncbi:tripartite tricarboxylate transporter permease [Stutzerimonas azotifigens]|uniref:C4-dicarboxylate ABC transporter permease n=1 Tax=Stutzerimonas azotifigens TaxID=291995 RepID=A0ABR5Z4F7_9GAMM|nr:tripartite tricarboxylate transporter permease [Stutzerimonas azotifigens]MBA1275011.1 C4-dicarboxylate ABC transporter permease [Stutzerimonas azotifigens]